MMIIFSSSADAKILPRFLKSSKKTNSLAMGISVMARLRTDRKALLVNFTGLSKAKSVMYTLSYTSNGIEQGISGILDSGGKNNLSRELLFGTCSSGVCRYHTNIKNMKFEVNSELTSGKSVIKRFRIKV